MDKGMQGSAKRVDVVNSSRDQDRIDRLSATLREIEELNGGFGLYLVAECIRLWRDVLYDGQRFELGADQSRVALSEAESKSLISHMNQRDVGSALSRLTSDEVSDDKAILSLVDATLGVLSEQISNIAFTPGHEPPQAFDSAGVPVDTRVLVTNWRSRILQLQEALKGLARLSALEKRIEEALEPLRDIDTQIREGTARLDAVRAELATAKSAAAQFKLADQFKKLSDGESKVRMFFRIVTGILLIGAVVVAATIPSDASWPLTISHIGVALAVGSGAVYAARLASSHGSAADWAKSVEVQLKTFQDFLGAIDDQDVRHRVYEEFGRRVLGPPPGGSGDETPPLPTAQLLELANVIASVQRRTST